MILIDTINVYDNDTINVNYTLFNISGIKYSYFD